MKVLDVSIADNSVFVVGFLESGSKEQLHITECAEIVFDFQETGQKQDDKALLGSPAPPSVAQASAAGIASIKLAPAPALLETALIASSVPAPTVTSVDPAPKTPVADPSVFHVGGWSLRPARYEKAFPGDVLMTVRPPDAGAPILDIPPKTISETTNPADLCEVPWDAYPDVSALPTTVVSRCVIAGF